MPEQLAGARTTLIRLPTISMLACLILLVSATATFTTRVKASNLPIDRVTGANAVASPALVIARSGLLQQGAGSTRLPVEVNNVHNLGAVTVVVAYDATTLRASACQRHNAFDVGLCNLQVDRDGDGIFDAVRFNLVSLNGLSVVPGASLKLVDITWETVESVVAEKTVTLQVEVSTFTDRDAIPLEVSAENGQVQVLPAALVTPTPQVVNLLHLPLFTYNWSDEPAVTPHFTCGGWQPSGREPGTCRQTVFSDMAVSDWRMSVDGVIISTLSKESATAASAEASVGAHARIEALYEQQWVLACEISVSCTP